MKCENCGCRIPANTVQCPLCKGINGAEEQPEVPVYTPPFMDPDAPQGATVSPPRRKTRQLNLPALALMVLAVVMLVMNATTQFGALDIAIYGCVVGAALGMFLRARAPWFLFNVLALAGALTALYFLPTLRHLYIWPLGLSIITFFGGSMSPWDDAPHHTDGDDAPPSAG